MFYSVCTHEDVQRIKEYKREGYNFYIVTNAFYRPNAVILLMTKNSKVTSKLKEKAEIKLYELNIAKRNPNMPLFDSTCKVTDFTFPEWNLNRVTLHKGKYGSRDCFMKDLNLLQLD